MVRRLHAQNKCRSRQTATDSRRDDQGRGDGQLEINTAPSVTYGPGHRRTSTCLQIPSVRHTDEHHTDPKQAVCSRERSAHRYK